MYFLDNSKMNFGGLVSTSNTYASDILTVKTNGNVYFSMGLIHVDD